jgi:hypothetical protein
MDREDPTILRPGPEIWQRGNLPDKKSRNKTPIDVLNR